MANFGRTYNILTFCKNHDVPFVNGKPLIRISKMMTRKNEKGETFPAFYKNEDKSSTGIQKIALKDSAGVFLATFSKKVAEKMFAGEKPSLLSMAVTERFFETVDPETGEEVQATAYSVHLPSENANDLNVDEFLSWE